MKFTLLYNQEQNKAELINRLILEPWAGYCEKNWISENHEQAYAPEHRVKRLLDQCGTLLLRDVPAEKKDTLTSYKELSISCRELCESDCPEAISAMLESGNVSLERLSRDDRLRYQMLIEKLDSKGRRKATPPAKKEQTRFDRLMAIRREYPGCQIDICRVDVDGGFFLCNERYRVDSSKGKYAPHKTRYGDQYDMDRILVITLADDRKLFADQDGYMIEPGLVEKTER